MKKLILALAVLVLAGPAFSYTETMEEKYLTAGGGSASASPLIDSYFHARWVEDVAIKTTIHATAIPATINVTVTKLIGSGVNAYGYTRVKGVWFFPRNGSSTDYWTVNFSSAASNTCFECNGGTAIYIRPNGGPVYVPLDMFGLLGVSAYIEASSGNMGLGIAAVQGHSSTRLQ